MNTRKALMIIGALSIVIPTGFGAAMLGVYMARLGVDTTSIIGICLTPIFVLLAYGLLTD